MREQCLYPSVQQVARTPDRMMNALSMRETECKGGGGVIMLTALSVQVTD